MSIMGGQCSSDLVMLGELQQGRLQEVVDLLGRVEVLGPTQVPHAQQQSLGQDQEGSRLPPAGSTLPLLQHTLCHPLQLDTHTHSFLI